MNLIEQLKKQEGFSSVVYKCSGGFNTIGYGYNLEANPLKLSSLEIAHAHTKGMQEHEAERLLKLMIKHIATYLENSGLELNLNAARTDVLINMAYNLGLSGLLKFKMMLACINKSDYEGASKAMINSLWAKQVKGRAIVLAEQMRSGVYAKV